MTNLELIKAALKLAQILGESEDPTAEQAADGLAAMNELFAEWDADGIDIGHYTQSSLAAESPIYSDAIRAAKYNLAVQCCAEWERTPPPLVLGIADSTHSRLRREAQIGQLKEADLTHLPGVVEQSNIESG